MKLLHVTCKGCSESDTVLVENSDLTAYVGGRLVQDVWPSWSAAEREKVIGWRSGMFYCDDCFPSEGVA